MSDLIYGRNPVLSALKGKRKVKQVLISNSMRDPLILDTCKQLGIRYELVDNRKLDQLSDFNNHQGVIAYLDPSHIVLLKN